MVVEGEWCYVYVDNLKGLRNLLLFFIVLQIVKVDVIICTLLEMQEWYSTHARHPSIIIINEHCMRARFNNSLRDFGIGTVTGMGTS